ncbi:hypothetical protein GCM10008904_26790 [Paraclostridium ghonii]
MCRYICPFYIYAFLLNKAEKGDYLNFKIIFFCADFFNFTKYVKYMFKLKNKRYK